MNEHAPLVHLEHKRFLQVFRDITCSTNERTVVASTLPESGAGNTTSLLNFNQAKAVASVLVLANMNSLPFDWTARFSVGSTHMSFFIVKQLPVLPPEAYLETSDCISPWVQLVVPRALELTYTSEALAGFAYDLGYEGPPFVWDEQRRHCLQSELDAIFAHMYGLDRTELEWILDPQLPSSSFPALKQNEIQRFGEYRTKRYVLQAFDDLKNGREPKLTYIDT